MNQFLSALHLHSLCAFPTNVTILSNHKSAADDKHILHFLCAITFVFFYSVFTQVSTHSRQVFGQRALTLQKKIFESREIYSFEEILELHKRKYLISTLVSFKSLISQMQNCFEMKSNYLQIMIHLII